MTDSSIDRTPATKPANSAGNTTSSTAGNTPDGAPEATNGPQTRTESRPNTPQPSLLLRLLVRLYPRRLRERYGQDLIQLHQQLASDSRSSDGDGDGDADADGDTGGRGISDGHALSNHNAQSNAGPAKNHKHGTNGRSETHRKQGGERSRGSWQAILDTLVDAPAAHWAELRRTLSPPQPLNTSEPGTSAPGTNAPGTSEPVRHRLIFDNLQRDLTVAVRALARRPGWTCLVIATLAIGLGGVAAMWTVVDDVLLKPLPYAEPARLLQLVGTEDGELKIGATVAFLDVMDWREQNEAFEDISAYDEWNPILTGSGDPVRLDAAQVNSGFFEILGVEPRAGRFFLAEEDVDGNDAVVVLSSTLWRSRFNADPDAIGRSILLNGSPHVIVGVTKSTFEDPGLSGRFESAELWRPLGYGGVEDNRLPNRGSESYVAIGRLKQDVNIEAAQAEIGTIAARLELEYPRSNTGRGVALVPIKDRLLGDVRGTLVLLLIAMACLLAIALLNIANLTLGRSTERVDELAVRASLGAGRMALLRPALAEGMLFGLAGGVAAVALAQPLLGKILTLATAELPRAERIIIDPKTAVAIVVCAILVGAVCAALPALSITRGAFNVQSRSRTSVGRSTLQLRTGLIAAEVAIALVLLTSGAVLARSLLNLQHTDAGIDPRGVLTFDLSPPGADYEGVPELDAYYAQVFEGLRAIPGVRKVATVNIIPLSGGFDGNGLMVPGQPSDDEDGEWSIEVRTVTPDYFSAIGTQLSAGRGIEHADRASSAPVVVINQTAKERFWPDADPLGAQIKVAGSDAVIVGVVADTKHLALDEPAPFQAYLSRSQGLVPWQVRRQSVVLRVDGDPLNADLGLVPQVRDAVWAVDGNIPLANLRSLQSVVNQTVSKDMLRAALVGAFALVAIGLSVIGSYGVTSYAVTLRRRELALRMALGARQARVLRDVVRQAAQPALIGLALGIGGSWLAVRLLAGFLHQVEGQALIGPLLAPLFLAVVVIASLGPARRATQIEPMIALREE